MKKSIKIFAASTMMIFALGFASVGAEGIIYEESNTLSLNPCSASGVTSNGTVWSASGNCRMVSRMSARMAKQ